MPVVDIRTSLLFESVGVSSIGNSECHVAFLSVLRTFVVVTVPHIVVVFSVAVPWTHREVVALLGCSIRHT